MLENYDSLTVLARLIDRYGAPVLLETTQSPSYQPHRHSPNNPTSDASPHVRRCEAVPDATATTRRFAVASGVAVGF
jgi:hypothetical protein